MSREDEYDITVSATRTIGGQAETKDLGTWDKLKGGSIDSEEQKYQPGGMVSQVTLGGRTTNENATVSRLYDLTRDHPNVAWLMGGVGKAVVVVKRTSLDVDGIAVSKPITYNGKLKKIDLPEPDSESSDAAIILAGSQRQSDRPAVGNQ